jgi:hypothetical protein
MSATSSPSPLPPDLIGYRFWRLGFDPAGEPVLWSVVAPYAWTEAVSEPADISAEGGSWTPHQQGIYAFSEIGSMRRRLTGGLLAGVVRLWGRVAVHEQGYRAERAEIVTLLPPVQCMLCHREAVAVAARPGGRAQTLCDWHRGDVEALPMASFLDALRDRYRVPALVA